MVCIFKACSHACPLPRGHESVLWRNLSYPPAGRWETTLTRDEALHIWENPAKRRQAVLQLTTDEWGNQSETEELPSWVQPSLMTADAGKDWGHEETGTKEDEMKKRKKEDEMVGWHHQLNRHEFEQTPGDSEGPGSWHAAVHGVAKSQTRLNNKKKCISS